MRVLIIDDAEAMRFLLRRVLTRGPGFEVVGEAGDGAQGIELARATHPDLILLDLRMPVMDGFEALPRLRAAAPTARIVVVSGLDPRDAATRTAALGADDYLEKDLPPAEFQRRLLAYAQTSSEGSTSTTPA